MADLSSCYYSPDKLAVLLLAGLDGVSLRKKMAVLSIFENLSDLIFNLREFKAEVVRVIGEDGFFAMSERLNALSLEAEKLEKAGVEILTIRDAEYPEKLRNIPDPPVMLFLAGNIKLLNTPSIAVVGTRKPSRYAVKVTEQFAREFARAGLTVVSGLARGIDTVAHKTALAENGATAAVLGSGLDVIYPSENTGLFNAILSSGGLALSEYPLGAKPQQYHFPERNRIVSGLSEAVFLPEAGERSGSLNTVSHALEQGRQPFIVPSTINNPFSAGSNNLLRDMQGAIALEPDDVLKAFGLSSKPSEKKHVQLDFTSAKITAKIEEEGEMHFEELLAFSGLGVQELTAVLMELELSGVIEKLSGNYFGPA
ncbi:MAG TPA: DNA-processing protein DprA [Eubacteriales bacterium]|jgi:DNA processing protein|nr:DNA-processing protein DprA [Eubacteriales bacterium]HRU84027.1 DNA-processing protein DprA [Eubacteriales bacterium]